MLLAGIIKGISIKSPTNIVMLYGVKKRLSLSKTVKTSTPALRPVNKANVPGAALFLYSLIQLLTR
jgi:hypothetical protein